MNNRVLQKASELLAEALPFALATVVRRERPTSGEPGDKAIITSDGSFLGSTETKGVWKLLDVHPEWVREIEIDRPFPGDINTLEDYARLTSVSAS